LEVAAQKLTPSRGARRATDTIRQSQLCDIRFNDTVWQEKSMDQVEETKKAIQRAAEARKKKSGKLSTVILLLILALGVGIMLYPTVSDWWNSLHATRAVANYVAAVEEMSDEERDAILSAALEYNAGLPLGVKLRLEDEERPRYESLLDAAGTGIMGYIQISSIGVDLPIYHGTSDSVLQIAIGHVEGTSLPVGGPTSHCVLSGHRGLPTARLFTDLDKLMEGDIFTITILDETATYQVDQIRIVLPEEVEDLAITPGKDYCTLVTCTPYGINTHRMLVRGSRVENLPEEVVITPDAVKFDPRLVVPAVAIPILFVMLVILLIVYRKKPAPKTKREILDEFANRQ